MEMDPSQWPRNQCLKGVVEVQFGVGHWDVKKFLNGEVLGSKVIGLRGSVRSKKGISICGGGCGVGYGDDEVCLGLDW
ncbi:hypothetical protein ACLOJK_028671 [Asimina triloba]